MDHALLCCCIMILLVTFIVWTLGRITHKHAQRQKPHNRCRVGVNNFTPTQTENQHSAQRVLRYGQVDHYLHVESVVFRCTGASPNRPLFIEAVPRRGVYKPKLSPTGAMTRWNVYRNTVNTQTDTLYAIALHTDPSMVLYTADDSTKVEVDKLFGARRFCWDITSVVASDTHLEVQVRGPSGYLGPSWTVGGSRRQGPLTAGAVKVGPWQKFSLHTNIVDSDDLQKCTAKKRFVEACHWSVWGEC
jgi:hypothetical protein